jgi:hypothetical protein
MPSLFETRRRPENGFQLATGNLGLTARNAGSLFDQSFKHFVGLVYTAPVALLSSRQYLDQELAPKWRRILSFDRDTGSPKPSSPLCCRQSSIKYAFSLHNRDSLLSQKATLIQGDTKSSPRMADPQSRVATTVQLTIDDFDPLFHYDDYTIWQTPDPQDNPTWWNETQQVTGSIWHEATYHYTEQVGAKVTLNFTGKSTHRPAALLCFGSS